ncbi:MAG: hypothetical protein IJP70_00985 [Bacteroidales bacterium]|nr:hypothetical protein [Bacteroidales bacterium]
MKKSILTLCFVLMAAMSGLVMAQEKLQKPNGKPGDRPSFEQFLAQKTRFLMEEMKLPAEDSARFMPVYLDLQKAKGELMRRYRKGREVGRRIRKGENVPDSLYSQAVFSDATLQIEDAKLDYEYLQKFSKVLTPKQLYSFQEAEKKFRNNLARQPRGEKKK